MIIEDLSNHANCEHGPTLLFSQQTDDNRTEYFYACSAFRDRKECSFFKSATDVNAQSIDDSQAFAKKNAKDFNNGLRESIFLKKVNPIQMSVH